MKSLKFSVFGLPRFTQDGQEIRFGRRKALALMAYLVARNQAQSRDFLCELFWSELDTSRENLRRELSLLNSLTDEKLLLADRSKVSLHPESCLEVDLQQFWSLVTEARVSLNAIELVSEDSIALLERAVTLYSDDFLQGFSIPGSVEFDNWQYYEAESIRRACSDVLQVLIEWYRLRSQYEKAIPFARQYLKLDPFNELAHRRLMTLLASAGEYKLALEQFAYCESLLRDELDISPDSETVALYEGIRNRDFSESQPATPEQYPHNIPAQTTAFIGRKREQQELAGLLMQETVRLISIIAPGGMGKTRLATETASALLKLEKHQFKDGIYLVELAPISDVDNIVPAILSATGYSLQADGRSPEQQLLDYLRDKEMLLVLDNFEHVLAGARTVSDILQIAAGVKILVTSRQALILHEETVFQVSGLDVPDSDATHMLEYGAVKLFMDTARRINRHFTFHEVDAPEIVRICHTAGGMPLGLILSASWLDTLSLAEISQELSQSLDFLSKEVRNLPERHHNIRAVFDPTWQRLSEQEQAVFMKLSVFHGGFTRQFAEKIAGATLYNLASLVKKSLIEHDLHTGRYRIHELLRQYAAEKLQQNGLHDTICDLHSYHYLDWLARLKEDLQGRRQIAALQECDAENDNLHEAWYRAVQIRDITLLYRAVQSFYHYWDMRGYFHKAYESLGHVLEELLESGDQDERYMLACIRIRQIFIETNGFKQYTEEGLKFANIHHDRAEIREDYFELALCLTLQVSYQLNGLRDNAGVANAFEQSIHYFRAIGDDFHLADVLSSASLRLQLPENITIIQEAIEIQEKIGNLHGLLWSAHNLAMIYFWVGKSEEAINYATKMLNYAQNVRTYSGIGRAHNILAWFYFCKGKFDSARNHGTDSVAIPVDHVWYNYWLAFAETIDCLIACLTQNDYENALVRLEQRALRLPRLQPDLTKLALKVIYCGSGDFTQVKQLLRKSLNIETIFNNANISELGIVAIVLANEGEQEQAIEILGRLAQASDGLTGWFWKWSLVQDLLEQLKTETDEDTFTQAWERGSQLNVKEMIPRILDMLEDD